MAGRDHTGAGKFGPERQRVGGKTHQIVDKQKQPSYARGELTRGKYEVADIGDGLGIGADPLGAFLVEPTWNAPSGSAPMPRPSPRSATSYCARVREIGRTHD